MYLILKSNFEFVNSLQDKNKLTFDRCYGTVSVTIITLGKFEQNSEHRGSLARLPCQNDF